MKTLKQRTLITISIMLIVAFGVVCLWPNVVQSRQLADGEMTAIHGMYKWCGWAKATCIDGCENVGTEADCDSSVECDYGDISDSSPPRTDPEDPWEGDWITCNSLYLSTSTPQNAINFCSPDPTAGLIWCEEDCPPWPEPQKVCGSWHQCWCKEYTTGDHCNLGTPPNENDCDHCD